MGFAVFFGFGPELWPISINFGWNKKVTNVKLGKCQYWSVCAERIDTTMQLFLRYWHSWAAQPPPESFCIDNRCSHCNRQSQTNLSSSKFFHKKADTQAQVVVHHASKLRILTGDQKCCPINMHKKRVIQTMFKFDRKQRLLPLNFQKPNICAQMYIQSVHINSQKK